MNQGLRIAGNVAKTLLISEGQTERFTFKKFDGSLLRAYVGQGVPYPEDQIEMVALRINPEEVDTQQPRLTQKVQTNSKDRFIIFDWGVDLCAMSIKGNTGNLLPDAIQGGLDPYSPVVDFVKHDLLQTDSKTADLNINTNIALSLASRSILANTSYFDLLNMSPKYRTFVKLRKLYLGFDADNDVGTLEFGQFVYRIFFVDFQFVQIANSPWNWTYTIVLNVLSDLTEFSRKGDSKIKNTGFVS